jgi:hypothetical protein
MSFSLDASGLRQIQNYAAAVSIEAGIVPIRGKSPECKPLDMKRHKQSVTIRRVGEDVVVKVYHTDVLTYKPDGEIVVDTNGYSSISTADVLARVLGMGVRSYGDRLWIQQVGGWYVLGRGTRLKHIDHIGRQVMNPIHVQVRQLNRKKTKVVRDQYRSFMAYARGMCKLLAAVDGSITVESARGDYLRDQDLWHLITCGVEADRLEDYAEALHSLMSVTCKQEWVYNGTNGVSMPYVSARRTTFAAMQRYMMKMAYKLHAADVLDTNALPLGQMGRDKYAAW